MQPQIEPLERRCLYDAGQLDTAFGSSGVVTRTGSTTVPTDSPEVHATSQGDIYLSARITDRQAAGGGTASVAIWRMHADGSPDTHFGNVGEVEFQLPGDVVFSSLDNLFLPVDVHSTTSTDGGIFVNAGYRLYKFTAAGKLDRTFGHRGHAVFTDFQPMRDLSLGIDAQDKIYVTGHPALLNVFDEWHTFTLLRLHPDGSLDRTFADHGKYSPSQTLSDPVPDVKILADQKLMLGVESGGSFDTFRLNTDGSTDISYGDKGLATTGFPNDDVYESSTIDRGITPDGLVFFVGSTQFDQQTPTDVFDAFGRDGALLQDFFPNQEAENGSGPVLQNGGLFILPDAAGPSFYAGQTALTAATTDAAAAMGNSDPNNLVRGVDSIALSPDGSILVETSQNGPGTPGSNTIVQIRRFFSDDSPAAQVTAKTLTDATTNSYRFKVQYHDDDGVSLATLGNDDITVLFPDGTTRRASLVATDSSTDAKAITATYRVAAPPGGWATASNGNYMIKVSKRTVRDINGNPTAPRIIGGFQIQIN